MKHKCVKWFYLSAVLVGCAVFNDYMGGPKVPGWPATVCERLLPACFSWVDHFSPWITKDVGKQQEQWRNKLV